MQEEVEKVRREEVKKKGREKKDQDDGKNKKGNQSKFFVDLRHGEEDLAKIKEILKEANNKNYGKEILFKDLAIYAIKKINPKDLEKLKENSLTEMEKIQRLLDEHNKKMGTNLELGEFLVKRLNIE